jgi:hypothetical protein
VSVGKLSGPRQPSRQQAAPRSLPQPRRGTNGPTSDLEFSVTGPGVTSIAAKLRAKTTGVSPFAIALAVTMTMIGGGLASLLTALACRIGGVTGLPVGAFCLVAPALAVITYMIISCCRPVTQDDSHQAGSGDQ